MNTIMLKWGNRRKGFLKSPKNKIWGREYDFQLKREKTLLCNLEISDPRAMERILM